MPKRQKLDLSPKARIVRDPRDATRDYHLPLLDARRLYESGQLARLPDYGGEETYTTSTNR